jgi:hypothetical protein
MARIKPKASELEQDDYIDPFNNFFIDPTTKTGSLVHPIILLLNHFSATKREDSSALYLLYWQKQVMENRDYTHFTIEGIREVLGWDKKKIVKARKVLEEFRLIHNFRAKGKGVKRKLVTRLKSKIDARWLLKKLNAEDPTDPKKGLLEILKIKVTFLDTYDEFSNRPEKGSVSIKYPTGINTRYSHGIKDTHDDLDLKNRNSSISKTSNHSKSKSSYAKQESSLGSQKLNHTPRSEKDVYHKVEDVPSRYMVQIRKLKKYMHKLFPKSYPDIELTSKEIIEQGNALRLAEFSDQHDWDTVLKPALVFARNEKFWLQNLRSYASLRTKWKNGETKLQNLIVQWENQATRQERKKLKSKIYKIEDYCKTDYEKRKAKQFIGNLNPKNEDIPKLANNLKTLHCYFDSIPQSIRKYSFFYETSWVLIFEYLKWLTEVIKFDPPHFKLFHVDHDMFKRFIENWVKQDTTISMTVADGKYRFRSACK